jgi:hypothetical protein
MDVNSIPFINISTVACILFGCILYIFVLVFVNSDFALCLEVLLYSFVSDAHSGSCISVAFCISNSIIIFTALLEANYN